MKKNVFKYATLSMALCASFACVSCSEEETPGPNPPAPETVITGDVNEDMILKSGVTYYLDGKLQVKAPATLTIEPGVKIIAKYTDNISYILIEQGAKINAVGTVENPIVMTSERDAAGSWGGLHICGKASINVDGGTGRSEIGNAVYGGEIDDDNSGKLKYIRMENTGQTLSADTESNGITFYGVGNGTEVSYVQIYNGKDDGIEFFGGTVNVDHAFVVNCGDDSFDWTEGWRGEGSYWVAYQQEGASCDCLIEADNNGNNNDATPVSCPRLSKLTLIGNNDAEKNYGVRLRAGTKVIMSDAQITGKANALRTETTQTETALKNGEATLNNVAISGTLSSKEGVYTNDMFLAAGNLTNQTFSFTDGFIGTTDGRGAVDASNNWTAGWTKTLPAENSPEANSVLSGDVTENMKLTSGNTYYLDGKLQVKAPATLTIEPGVKIIAKYTDNISYILIEQGAKINAVGTAENPIVMTSERDAAGSWGGLHICGKASINVDGGTGKSEIGNAVYGGETDDDNSGKLKYIRMENTGQTLSADTESNGITFYGVGNGTEVSYVQIYNGKDDGIEFFGGTVNVDHAITVNCGDDSFDWTEGWRGEGSYWVAYQQEGASCDCLIEADNNGNNNDATPVSCPRLSKLTLIGNNDAEKNYGVRLRAGTKVIMSDAQITGKANALRTETTQTETALKNGEATLNNVAISGTLSSKEGVYTNDMFLAAGNLTNQTFSFTDRFVGTTDGRGAVETANNWTAGWTK